MANIISYKKNTNTKIAAKGLYRADSATIETDDGIYKVETLLKDFDGYEISFSAATKTDEELDIPYEEELEDSLELED